MVSTALPAPHAVGDSPEAAHRYSAMIRKQLDGIVEAAHGIFADALEIEIAFDEIGERLG
jgi:hypothetical protein